MSTLASKLRPSCGRSCNSASGFTLVELMVTIAVLAVIAALALPAYTGYIKESQLGAARMNADSLRLYLEDYRLDNGTYIVGGDTSYDKNELETNFGWRPDGDKAQYSYAVTAGTNTWSITIEHLSSGNWIRCEDRMNSCCDIDTAGATKTACP
jgi:type IV pilus assembly protein PilE